MDYGPGGSFGELALVYNCERAATVRAITPCRLWTMDLVTFRRYLATAACSQVVSRCEFLRKVPLLAELTNEQVIFPVLLDTLPLAVLQPFLNRSRATFEGCDPPPTPCSEILGIREKRSDCDVWVRSFQFPPRRLAPTVALLCRLGGSCGGVRRGEGGKVEC